MKPLSQNHLPLSSEERGIQGVRQKMGKILMAPIAVIIFVIMYVVDAVRFAIISPFLAFVIPVIVLAIVGSLFGLLTGFLWDAHLIAAIVIGIIFLVTWPRSQKRQDLEIRALAYAQALWGGIAVGLACYFVGSLVD